MNPQRTLIYLIACCLLTHSAMSAGRLAVSLNVLTYTHQATVVGVMLSLFALIPMLCSVQLGRWVERVGPRKPLLLGIQIALVGSAIAAALPLLGHYWLPRFETGIFLTAMALCAALLGVGVTAAVLPIQTMIGEQTDPDRRRRMFAWLALGMSSSGALSPTLSGFAIDHVGYRSTFALFCIAPALALLMLVGLKLLPIRPMPRASAAPDTDGSKLLDSDPAVVQAQASQNQPGVIGLLKQRPLLTVLVVNMLIAAAWDLHTFIVPIYGKQIGLSASTIGTLLGVFGTATFVIRICLPWLQKHLSEWMFLHLSLLITASVYIVFPLAHHPVLMGCLSFIAGLALGSVQPSFLSLLHERAPAGRGAEVLGLRIALTNSSSVALPIFFGALGTALGLAPMFWITSAALLACTWFTRREGKQP